jgi:hypothetical protein
VRRLAGQQTTNKPRLLLVVSCESKWEKPKKGAEKKEINAWLVTAA